MGTGISQPGWWTELYECSSGSGQCTSQGSGQGPNQGAGTPPPHRRLAKSFSVASGHQTNRKESDACLISCVVSFLFFHVDLGCFFFMNDLY